MNIEYKVMTESDYDGVYELWMNTPGMGINSTDDSREGVEKYIKRNPTTSFVALVEGKVVGAILAGHDGRRGFIQHIAVLSEFRKHGIASILVDRAMNALEEEGIHKVALLAFKKNELGNSFWDKMEFIVREDVYYRNKSIHELEYRANPYRNE